MTNIQTKGIVRI